MKAQRCLLQLLLIIVGAVVGLSKDAIANPSDTTPVVDALEQSFAPELLADPNPLSQPSTSTEVTIETTQVITLEVAIELAYANNPDLQAALLELDQSRAALREARAALYPTVTANADVTTQENIMRDDSDTRVNGQAEVTYNLFTSGQRTANIRASKAQVQFSELEVERRQESLRLTVANLYYALQEATEQIRIEQAFVDETNRNLRDTKIRQQAGVGTRFDVLRSEVQFANARQSLIQAQSQEKVAQRDLARLLNLPTTINIQATSAEQIAPWPLNLEDSIILAFQNRAELDQQLAQRELSQQQAIATRASLGPQVSLFANYVTSDILDSDNSTDNYSFGARFSMLLFDGGAAKARSRQQENAAAIAEQDFAETLDQVRFEVEQSYFNLQANQENIATAQVAVTQAEEALRLANLRFDAGVGTQLDVLTAQSELTQAEGNLITALLGYNRAVVGLQRAVSNFN